MNDNWITAFRADGIAAIGVLATVFAGPIAFADGVQQLKDEGSFGFPVAVAETLCDTDDLRLQTWIGNSEFVVQAIIWNDGDDKLGETNDGREIGDNSSLIIDVDGNKARTAKIDRNYSLNPWPSTPGLRYSIPYEGGASSHIKSDSIGRGSIRLIDVGEGKRVRVDTFVIPFTEIELKSGQTIRLAYLGASTVPEMTVNSVGFKSSRPRYYSRMLPHEKFHQVTLKPSAVKYDVSQVPAGREDEQKVAKRKLAPVPKVGTVPPEVFATDWLNSQGVPSLKALQGKVVLIDFWATWCGPCIKGIPHLNELQKQYKDDGLVILSFTNQSRRGIENFLKVQKMNYVVGTASKLSEEYGIAGLPHTFLIGRDGKLLWHDVPSQAVLADKIQQALAAE